MAAVLALLLRFLPPAAAILSSAVGLGHRPFARRRAALGPGHLVAVPDLLDALRRLARARLSGAGVGIAAPIHALQNLGPALVIAFG